MPASFRSKGAWAAGTTSFVAAVPTAGNAPQSGDALYIVMESADSSTASGTPTLPSGWSLLFHDVTREGLTGASATTVFGKIAGAGEGDVTVSGVGDHCSGSMLVVQNHGLAAITDTVVGAAGSSSADTAVSIPAITVEADSLVVMVIGTSRDSASTTNFSGWTNANLSGITEREDAATTNGQGGGVGYATAGKATTGSTGASTATQATSVGYVSVHLGIPPSGPTTYTLSVAGTITPAGALAKVTSKTLAAAITPIGALTRLLSRSLSGALTPSGLLSRETRKTFNGSSTPTGALSSIKVVVRSFAGAITPSGVLSRLVLKTLTGGLTPAGSLSRETRKTFTGSLTPSGVLSRVLARALAGSVTAAGVLSKRMNKPLGGQVSSSGGLTKEIRRTLAGQIASSGLLTKNLGRLLAGAMTPAGTLTRQTRKTHDGALTPSGIVVRSIARSIGGAIQPTGTSTREVQKALGGEVAPTGVVTHLRVHLRNLLLTVGSALTKWAASAATLKWFPGAGQRKSDPDDADSR